MEFRDNFWDLVHSKDSVNSSRERREMLELYEKLRKEGISEELESTIQKELSFYGNHEDTKSFDNIKTSPYQSSDYESFYGIPSSLSDPIVSMNTIEDLLERDKQREKDGFPKKIKIGSVARTKKGKRKVVVIPTTTEDKFVHDPTLGVDFGGTGSGGAGKGKKGDCVGKVPIYEPGDDDGGAGKGKGEHDIEEKAYEIGEMLSKRFKLPNIEERRKKKAIIQEHYDLTDKNRGFGQILDKKATLKEIVKRNWAIGRIKDPQNIDLQDLIVDPKSKVYKILSKETDYLAAAIVFLVRDYSGSPAWATTNRV